VYPTWFIAVICVLAAVVVVASIVAICYCVQRYRRTHKPAGTPPPPPPEAILDDPVEMVEMDTWGAVIGTIVSSGADDGTAIMSPLHPFYEPPIQATRIDGAPPIQTLSLENTAPVPALETDAAPNITINVLLPQPAPYTDAPLHAAATAATPAASLATLFQERCRLHNVIRGHAAPTTEPFSFALLHDVSAGFSGRILPPSYSAPSVPVAFLQCVDVAHGLLHPCVASVSAGPAPHAHDAAARVATLAALVADDPCLPLVYGFAMEHYHMDATAAALGMPAPPPGWAFVALLYEAAPEPWTCANVLAHTHVPGTVIRSAATHIARSARTLGAHGIAWSAHPQCVAFRGGSAYGAPHQRQLWITAADAALEAPHAMTALVNGLFGWQQLTGEAVLPSSPPTSIDSLTAFLAAASAPDEAWTARPPFEPDAPCPIPVHRCCTLCGALPFVQGHRIAQLRCTVSHAHAFCADCVARQAAGGSLAVAGRRNHCPAPGHCRGAWAPSDVLALRMNGDRRSGMRDTMTSLESASPAATTPFGTDPEAGALPIEDVESVAPGTLS
jgi:hypothetical protein